MNFISVLIKMVELFLVMIVGYIANKGKLFDREARLKVTKLVLNVTLPATILAAVMTQDNLPGASQIAQLLLVAAGSYLILFAGAFIFTKCLCVDQRQQGIYQFMFIFGNVGFIGYPVTQAIFGNRAVFYTSVFNLPFNLLVYSIGVGLIQKSAADQTEGQTNKLSWKMLVSPCMIACYISLLMAFCNVQGPAFLGDTCDMIGDITTPAALMIIGSSLADMKIKEMFGNIRIYVFALLRLIIAPLLTFAIFRTWIQDELLLGIAVIVAAMPVATNGTMLCLQYKGDEHLMAEGTFITTLLSMITIPLLAMAIQ